MMLMLARIAAATEVIVDDQDGAPWFTTTTSNWDTWGMGTYGYDGGDTSYHYLTSYAGDGSRTGTATWTPELPTAGTWRIETWFRRTDNRTDDADHYVYDRDGSHRVIIDQTGDGASGWVELGTYSCDAGTACYVVLDGDDGESDEANAMRFTLVSEDPDPPADTGEPPETPDTGDPAPTDTAPTDTAPVETASPDSGTFADSGLVDTAPPTDKSPSAADPGGLARLDALGCGGREIGRAHV